MILYSTLTDQQLLAFVNEGEEAAFDEIYKRYWKKLYAEAFRRLKNAHQCEEIVQDVYTALWLKRGQQQIDTLLPYLLTSVKYQVYMLYKKEKSLPFFEEPLEHMAKASLEADSLFFAKELKHCIDLWLEQQPEKRREIFRLRYVEDFTTKEISDMLGISQKTVQNTLLSAVKGLRSSLGKFVFLLPVVLVGAQNRI
jgi:RNA polymerase sigma factor (sigma-70 family)